MHARSVNWQETEHVRIARPISPEEEEEAEEAVVAVPLVVPMLGRSALAIEADAMQAEATTLENSREESVDLVDKTKTIADAKPRTSDCGLVFLSRAFANVSNVGE